MKRAILLSALALGFLAVVASQAGLAKSKDGPIKSVTFAKSWDAAVEEARLRNVPIVIHRHGFY